MPPQQSALAVRSLEEVPGPAPGTRFVLKKLYGFLNKEIFGDGLPRAARVVWEKSLTYNFGVTCQRGSACNIKLNHTLLYNHPSRDFLIDVLLHEMVHESQRQFCPEETEAHGPHFMQEMHRINTQFGRHVAISFSSPHSDRELDKVCTHRWKCTLCAFTVKKSRNVPPGNQKHQQHADTGCVGELIKMSPAEAAADIAEFCALSLAKEHEEK